MKVSDLGATAGFFAKMGFAPFWAYLVSYVELIGGVAILLGVGTCFASTALVIVMAVAIYVLRDSLTTMGIAPISLFFSNLALVLAGSGKYSFGCKFCKCKDCGTCAVNSPAK